MSAYHLPQTLHTRSKSNQEQESDSASYLGPTTVSFIGHHNLMHLVQFLGLIIQNNLPTRWGTMLCVLSLSDDLHDGILGALMADLEAGVY